MQERKIRMRLQPQDKLLKPNERSCVRWTFRALKLDIQITGVSEKNGSVFTLMQNLWKSKNYCGKTNALIFNMKVQNVKKKKKRKLAWFYLVFLNSGVREIPSHLMWKLPPCDAQFFPIFGRTTAVLKSKQGLFIKTCSWLNRFKKKKNQSLLRCRN